VRANLSNIARGESCFIPSQYFAGFNNLTQEKSRAFGHNYSGLLGSKLLKECARNCKPQENLPDCEKLKIKCPSNVGACSAE